MPRGGKCVRFPRRPERLTHGANGSMLTLRATSRFEAEGREGDMSEKSQFELAEEQSQKLEVLREERRALSGDLYQTLERTTEAWQRLETGNPEALREAHEDLSKLESAIARSGEFRETIANLAAGLTDEIGNYVQFVQRNQNYKGAERLVAWIWRSKANEWRTKRLYQQSPRENLRQFVEYGMQLVEEIQAVRADAVSMYQQLQSNLSLVVAKIADYGPKQEALELRRNALAEEFDGLEKQYESADPQRQAQLIDGLNQKRKALAEATHEYQQAFTIYKQAQESYQANVQATQSFEKMMHDLGRQATAVQEKLDNATKVYEAAPEAVKIVLITAGTERIDTALNVALDQSLDMITNAAEGVSDATLTMEETPFIDPAKMKSFLERFAAVERDFAQRWQEIKSEAAKTPAERYDASGSR